MLLKLDKGFNPGDLDKGKIYTHAAVAGIEASLSYIQQTTGGSSIAIHLILGYMEGGEFNPGILPPVRILFADPPQKAIDVDSSLPTPMRDFMTNMSDEITKLISYLATKAGSIDSRFKGKVVV